MICPTCKGEMVMIKSLQTYATNGNPVRIYSCDRCTVRVKKE